MAPAPPDAPQHTRAALAWACAAFAGGVLLHADRLPGWAVAGAVALIAWRLTVARPRQLLASVTVRALLALALVALVLARYHTLNGLTPGTTLLVLMAGLKLLETRGPRDAYVIVGVALFLLLAACLDRQDLWRVPLYGLQVVLCCAALAVIASPALPASVAMRLAGRALLLALPLAVALFVLFPRLPGAFWAIPGGDEALTGLSDSMSPGSISRLVTTYEPAFRVTFDANRPRPEELYWRGPVLHEFDGFTWRRRPAAGLARARLEYLGTPYRYRVALEPSGQRFRFALDTPAQASGDGAVLSDDHELITAEPVSAPVSYEALSYTRTRAAGPLDAASRLEDTQLPPGPNPRALALAQALRAEAPTDAALVQAVLAYLHNGGFSYSVTPERLGADSVDEFLFRTREGFCGHYASAFVTLMRGAGVPARVVTGYLGGEWNPIGGYLVVRQSDAHSWAEVWLSGRGWTRVDPTLAVAPGRLRQGILDLLPQALSAPERLLRGSRWLGALLRRWDAANAWWGDHVVRFDLAAQLGLLERLGVRTPDARYLGWGFMVALIAWLALSAWQLGRAARAPPPDALARAYGRLCRKLARIAPPRAPHQGPMSLAASVGTSRPDLKAAASALLERYAQLRYGRPAPTTRSRDIEEFRRAVARLKLPRQRREPRTLSRT